MNILIITTHLNHGGITRYVLNLAGGLKEKGHKVFVASSGGSCLGLLGPLGVEHINIPIKTKSELSPRVILSFLKLSSELREKSIDIMHCQTRVTQVLGQLLSFFSGIPFVTTCHGFFKRRISRRLFPSWGKFVIAISEPVKEHLINDFKLDSKKIRLVYHGIRNNKQDSQSLLEKSLNLKNRLGLGSGPVVGIIARLSEVKGHKYLVEAFKRVCEVIQEANLLIVGEGPLREGLDNLISSLGLGKRVFFSSSVDDIREGLSLMDVLVVPSVQEGLGLSIMEAQSFGVPVVGFEVGGITNLIKDGKTGLLAKYLDITSLAECILRILKDNKLSEELSETAKRFIDENFSFTDMIKNTEDIYEESLR